MGQRGLSEWATLSWREDTEIQCVGGDTCLSSCTVFAAGGCSEETSMSVRAREGGSGGAPCALRVEGYARRTEVRASVPGMRDEQFRLLSCDGCECAYTLWGAVCTWCAELRRRLREATPGVVVFLTGWRNTLRWLVCHVSGKKVLRSAAHIN
jgi:hypothetical protein